MAMKFSIPFMRHLLYAQFTNAEAGHWLRLARTDFAMASISSSSLRKNRKIRGFAVSVRSFLRVIWMFGST
jgi:hypothetical protein